jgi:hypothetical protein
MKYDEISEKYKAVGIDKGGEFLLPPDLAISFIDELSENNILILGITTWIYVDLLDGQKGIAQDLSNDYSVEERLIRAQNVKQSAQQCIHFVQSVTDIVDLVSIDTW